MKKHFLSLVCTLTAFCVLSVSALAYVWPPPPSEVVVPSTVLDDVSLDWFQRNIKGSFRSMGNVSLTIVGVLVSVFLVYTLADIFILRPLDVRPSVERRGLRRNLGAGASGLARNLGSASGGIGRDVGVRGTGRRSGRERSVNEGIYRRQISRNIGSGIDGEGV